MSRRFKESMLGVWVLVAICGIALAATGCGHRAAGHVYRNTEFRFALRYDDRIFSPGQLADIGLIQAAHAKIEATPRFVVQYVDKSSPSAQGGFANGFLVAVFDFPPEARMAGIWNLGDQVIPQALPQMETVLGAGSLGTPARIEYRGMKGYVDSVKVSADGETYSGTVFGLAEDPFFYEIVLQSRPADAGRLRAALGDIVWTFRAGADTTIRDW